MTDPLAPGSVSLRLYAHNELAPTGIIDMLVSQAALAAECGFDGIMTSEHHGGFSGYLPNPLQVASWCLDAMASGWAAACPLLLPLRPPALVAEETAWLAARFPGRVGLGVAAGALPLDFELLDTDMNDLTARFADSLRRLARWLSGTADDALAQDLAVAACRVQPIPLVSAAMGSGAVRRAADLGVGILFDSLSTPERCRMLADNYRAAGGDGSVIAIRRVWVGDAPTALVARQVDTYRGYTPTSTSSQWTDEQMIAAADPDAVVAGLRDVQARSGADALNLRVHVEGVSVEAAREQIEIVGREVLPHLR